MTWTSKELAAASCHGTLTLGGVSMNNKAWASLNNYILWKGAPRRGENSLIPDLPGRIAQPRRKDEATHTLECIIIGDCGATGTPHSTREAGLATNWLTIKNGLLSYTGTTITASLALPNGTTLTGPVQIIDHDMSDENMSGVLTFSLDLVIPAGELT